MIKYNVANHFKEAIVLYNSTNYAKICQRHSPSHLLPEKQQVSLQLISGTMTSPISTLAQTTLFHHATLPDQN